MKRRILTALVVALVALMIVSPAFAYNGIQIVLYSGSSGTADWTHGGTFSVSFFDVSATTIVVCNDVDYSDPTTGPYSYALNGTNCPFGVPDTNDPVWGSFDPHAPDGNVSVINFAFVQDGTSNTYTPVGSPFYTNTGPNAVELTDFTVTSQTSNTWLPFVLLVGSVALVGSAVAVIRKRRA